MTGLWKKWRGSERGAAVRRSLLCAAVFMLLSACLVWARERGDGEFLMKPDELRLLPNPDNFQSLCAVIKTAQGGLVVVDGGWEGDSERLAHTIRANGGRVKAWLITHPHADHAGALGMLLRDGALGIVIEKIYCSLADPQWYQDHGMGDPGIADELLAEFQRLPAGTVENGIGKGTEIATDDVTITVMNDRGVYPVNSVNNSCIVYKMRIQGKSILFLGDLGREAGEQLLRDAGADGLKSDIVQMAHHGQGGVGRDVYAAIAPETCLWATPEWLWNNDSGAGYDSGPWKTLKTRAWMEELGVTDHRCTKDGEIHMYFP